MPPRTDLVTRPATLADLRALTDIYNHYVLHSAVTFDLQAFTPEARRAWFDEHLPNGPHRLRVATSSDGRVLGYATTSWWRPKPAYSPTVEASVYCHPDAIGQGCGRLLYSTLFDSIANENVHSIVAGICVPNEASIALHERLGFRLIGTFREVGFKFDRYWDVAWYQRPLRV